MDIKIATEGSTKYKKMKAAYPNAKEVVLSSIYGLYDIKGDEEVIFVAPKGFKGHGYEVGGGRVAVQRTILDYDQVTVSHDSNNIFYMNLRKCKDGKVETYSLDTTDYSPGFKVSAFSTEVNVTNILAYYKATHQASQIPSEFVLTPCSQQGEYTDSYVIDLSTGDVGLPPLGETVRGSEGTSHFEG